MLARNDMQIPLHRIRESVNLSDLVAEEVLMFEPVFFQNRRTLLSELEEEISVCGNEAQIHQLLRILLDNAVKYSVPEGATEVFLKRAGRRSACLQVRSQGEPIPKSEQKAVFRRFYRADRARSSGQGYGLGLAIASEIVRSCRGKIGIETEEGWNCFYVIFRLK